MINFELHFTIKNLGNITKVDLYNLGFKLCDINLKLNYNHLMVTTNFKAKNFDEAMKVCLNEKTKILINSGIKIIRTKLESDTYIQNNFLYYEIHVKCKTSEVYNIKDTDFHISYNEFKPDITFATIRNTDIKTICKVKNKIKNIIRSNITIPNYKIEIEYACFDSNINLDTEWMSAT